MNVYPRESVEFQPIVVTLDGNAYTTPFQYALTSGISRPETWADTTTLDSQQGFMVSGLEVGAFYVWAKIVDVPETPVICCGMIVVA